MTLPAALTALAIVCITIIGLAGTMDREAEQQSADLYCEMVQIHHDTQGRYGWPAYRSDVSC